MRYFTADIHFGHENIIKYCDRPWSNAREMDFGIIERFNSVLTDEDELWILGDLALGKQRETVPLLGLINGRKHIVAGNHDKIWRGHKKMGPSDVEFYRQYGDIESDYGIILIDIGKDKPYPALYSHFPYDVDPINVDTPGDDRYAKYRWKRHTGMGWRWLIHGHVHDAWKIKDDQINVGVDVWDFYPVPETTIAEIINA